MYVIVVMPRVHQARRDIGPGGHEETGKVRNAFVGENVNCG